MPFWIFQIIMSLKNVFQNKAFFILSETLKQKRDEVEEKMAPFRLLILPEPSPSRIDSQ